MRKSLSLLLIVTLFPLSALSKAMADAPISNVVVLGDSLSDTGNLPETSNAYIDHNSKNNELANLESMYYVPVSNPVDPNGYKLNLFRDKSGNKYAMPDLSSDHLPSQFLINNQPRSYRSMNWVEFFMADAYQDQLINDQSIIPWAEFEAMGTDNNHFQSVNYAWAGATSRDDCNFNDNHYTVAPTCDVKDVLEARKNAMENPNIPEFNQDVLVPGLRMQINYLINDIESKRLKVGPKTLYTVWVGGNDFIDDSQRFQDGHVIQALKDFFVNLKENDRIAISMLLQPPINAKHIMVMTVPDPRLTPEFTQYSNMKRDMGAHLQKTYNHDLYTIVQQINRTYGSNITFVPADQWFQQMANNEPPYDGLFPRANLGVACETDIPAMANLTPPSSNCKGYLFWNAIHPSLPVSQILGYQIEQSALDSLSQ